jgi:hypothetical protein
MKQIAVGRPPGIALALSGSHEFAARRCTVPAARPRQP